MCTDYRARDNTHRLRLITCSRWSFLELGKSIDIFTDGPPSEKRTNRRWKMELGEQQLPRAGVRDQGPKGPLHRSRTITVQLSQIRPLHEIFR